MLTVSLNVGRLIEIRAKGQVSIEDFAGFRSQFTELLMKAGKKIVNVSDLREIDLLPPDVFAALSRMAQTDNAMIERAAYFTSAASAASMQFDQLIRDLKHPQRGVFQRLPELENWVAASLTPEELARAHQFLNG
jgi:hypothetical protein